jgi:acetyl esterase/lipase
VAHANPLNYVDANSPAFHIRHGDSDRLVAIGQSEILAESLAQHNIFCDFKKIPGADHGFDGMEDAPSLVDDGIAFLKQQFN